MYRKLCNGAQKTVHSIMLKSQNKYNIKQLSSGMLVANKKHVSFVSIIASPKSKTHIQNSQKRQLKSNVLMC
jgi:hypothetical protein